MSARHIRDNKKVERGERDAWRNLNDGILIEQIPKAQVTEEEEIVTIGNPRRNEKQTLHEHSTTREMTMAQEARY